MQLKGKALRRALELDAIRVGADIPLITDTTELVTPETAQDMLTRNKHNRPINWSRVEEYAAMMKAGEWRLHAQGIILDKDGNILTGQKRLWAIVVSATPVYMRVSRGNPTETARLIDRGTPQTARDLASRETERKHSPTEASIVRAYCAAMGNIRPSVDQVADCLAANKDALRIMVAGLKRVKKTKAILMVCGALIAANNDAEIESRLAMVPDIATSLEIELLPHTPSDCWNKGAAFGLAMDKAVNILRRR